MSKIRDISIISTQRSGTQYLSTLIASHHKIQSRKEILNPVKPYSFPQFASKRGIDVSKLGAGDGPEFLSLFNAYIGSNRPKDKSLVFVLMYNQIERFIKFGIGTLLNRFHVVHLVRRNLMRTHVSELINSARQNGERLKPPHHEGSEHASRLVKITVPAGSLLSDLRNRAAKIEDYRRHLCDTQHIEIIYENLVAEPNIANHALRQFEYDTASLSTSLHKSNPYRLEQMIGNYSEVCDVLIGTEFELFLKE